MWQIVAPRLYFYPLQLHSWLALLALGPLVAEGCIRRSSFTAPVTTTTVSGSGSASPTVSPSHKLPCLPDEIHNTNCLHGGTCYAAVMEDHRESFCHCGEEWTGTRCEQYFIDPEILANMEANMRTANIAAGISVCILLLFICLFAGYVYIRKRKKTRKEGAVNNIELSDPDTERHASADIGNGSTDLHLKSRDKQSLRRDDMNNICVPEIHISDNNRLGEQLPLAHDDVQCNL